MTRPKSDAQQEQGSRPAAAATAVAAAGLRAALVASLLSLSMACATSGLKAPAGDPGVTVRPEAPADYDVLVGEFLVREGEVEGARDAFARAAAKDSTSAVLQRRAALLSAQLEDTKTAIEFAARAVELEPEDESGRLLLARLYRINRNFAGVERALTGEDGRPVSMRCGLILMQVHLESSSYPQALGVAAQLVEEYPESMEPYLALASVQQRMGQRLQMLTTLDAAVDRFPEHVPLYARLAKLRRDAGDFEGAIAVHRRLLERQPDHYGTLAALGETQVQAGNLEGAAEAYGRLNELFPDNEAVIQRLVGIRVQLEDVEGAARLIEDALERLPDSGDLLYLLGLIRLEQQDRAGAVEALERVPLTHSSSTDARLRLARLHEEDGELKRALAVLEELRVLRPDRELDFHTAGVRVRTGDFAGGVALLEEWIAKDPKDSEALYQMGIVHDIADRDDEAIEWMRTSLGVKPDNAHAMNYIGYTLAEHGADLDEAEELILSALDLKPDDGFITDSLGWVYYKRAQRLVESGRGDEAGDWIDRALEQLERAVKLSGGDPVISEHLGDLYVLMGDKPGALGHYEEAVRQQPRFDEQPDLEQKLEALRQELELELETRASATSPPVSRSADSQ